jgi:hypothetical protein
MHSVLFWTLSDPVQQCTAVHCPITPADFRVLLTSLLNDHRTCLAVQDAHMNQVVAHCSTNSCFVFYAWMSIIILNHPAYHLCFILCFNEEDQ